MKRYAGVRDRATASRRDVGRLVVVCLVLGVVILVLSGLVGALDLLAVGAVLGVWALCVAARLILGRYGEDWALPADTGAADLWPRLRARVSRRGSASPAGPGAGGRLPWDRARSYLDARRGRRAAARLPLPSPASPSGAMGPGAVRADAARPARPGGAARAGARRPEAAVGASAGKRPAVPDRSPSRRP
ncbi:MULTISPECIES: hypothetical protein [Pseudofrankia]|uniref:hypothetical protein n=1 Tax=Pseudofrankia TaxID=2994363 RepID=UPI000234C012|nr:MULTISPECIES: hypothetical protein [Pseudofrankia]OHV35811.1 hypothetical protein BCD49_21215 [Pseudofrankia sp. EUN1h]